MNFLSSSLSCTSVKTTIELKIVIVSLISILIIYIYECTAELYIIENVNVCINIFQILRLCATKHK